MAIYSVRWKTSALKDLKKLDRQVVPRVVEAVEALGAEPLPPHCRKLQGSEQSYRIRVGDYRVVYRVLESRLVVEVIRARHRKDVYRAP